MALTDNTGLSAADIAAVTGNNANGFGFGGHTQQEHEIIRREIDRLRNMSN